MMVDDRRVQPGESRLREQRAQARNRRGLRRAWLTGYAWDGSGYGGARPLGE